MTRMYYTTGLMRGRTDIRLDVEANPYEVQEYLAGFRRSKSAMIIKGTNTARWSSLPQRKAVTARAETKKAPPIFRSAEYEIEDQAQDGFQINLDITRSPMSSRSRPEFPKVNNAVSVAEPEQTTACTTKYFPYRRSGYLDHVMRQTRVNSARVLMSENPDMANTLPAQRIKSAHTSAASVQKVALPARAQTAELIREPPATNARRRQEMKLRKVEIKDSAVVAVKTKEYTTDPRNVYYTRRAQKEVPRETVKAVRFDGGFQEAVVSPRHQQEEVVEPELVAEEPAPTRQEAKHRDDVILEYQPPMDTSLLKETNHIPLNIYKPQNGQTLLTNVPRKNIDDYEYKTDKVLSYYLQQERRPGTAKFDFTAQSKLTINSGNKSANRGRLTRPRSHSNGNNESQQGQSEVQPNLGGGFLKIHKPLVLHQRPAEDEETLDAPLTPKADEPAEGAEHKPKKLSTNKKPPIDPSNLCALCNSQNSADNWKMVDAMLSQSSAQDLTLPALKKTMKHP